MLQPGAEALEPTACFDLMLAGYERAQQRVGSRVERCYRIGQLTVRFLLAGEALVQVVSPALAHLRIDSTPAADLTVHLWDSASTGEPLSPLVGLLAAEIARDPYRALSTRHEIIGISNDRVPATWDQWSGVLSVLDRKTTRAVYWIEDAAAVPYFERGAPLRTLLSWWLADIGCQSVHAAAVGYDWGGVLLAGGAGSGKSTTALACLDSDLGYAGDDYCAFSVGPSPRAFSMYNTAKLNGLADLQRQPRFLPLIENPDACGTEKLMMFLERHFPNRVVLSFPIDAVLVPRVTDDAIARLCEVGAGHALRALAPTTLMQLPGASDGAMRAIGELVRSVPCYELRLGKDLATVPRAIAELLAG